MPFSTISVAIDKHELLNSKYKKYDVLETAYIFLVERFDKFLTKEQNKGIMKIDKTSNKQCALNAKDKRILDIINRKKTRNTLATCR